MGFVVGLAEIRWLGWLDWLGMWVLLKCLRVGRGGRKELRDLRNYMKNSLARGKGGGRCRRLAEVERLRRLRSVEEQKEQGLKHSLYVEPTKEKVCSVFTGHFHDARLQLSGVAGVGHRMGAALKIPTWEGVGGRDGEYGEYGEWLSQFTRMMEGMDAWMHGCWQSCESKYQQTKLTEPGGWSGQN